MEKTILDLDHEELNRIWDIVNFVETSIMTLSEKEFSERFLIENKKENDTVTIEIDYDQDLTKSRILRAQTLKYVRMEVVLYRHGWEHSEKPVTFVDGETELSFTIQELFEWIQVEDMVYQEQMKILEDEMTKVYNR
jgi:hypothetical protein